MASTETFPRRIARSGLGYAYLMTGVAVGSIVLGSILGSIFVPDLVTGSQQQHTHIAAFTAWIWALIGIGMVVPVAIQGIRAEVTDRAPWTMLGLGVGAIWLAGTAVAVFAPVWVTGTDPEQLPLWALLTAIAEVILTGMLCNFVKTTAFQTDEAKTGSATTTPMVGAEPGPDDATVKLRRLAQLRGTGAISDAEFEAKKKELLSRI